jgi:hypothetical protein
MSQQDVISWDRPLSRSAETDITGAEAVFNNDDRRWRAVLLTLLGVYALLFAFNTVTRTRNFEDPDTMNFVDIARHITLGQGVKQATLGFNQPVFDTGDAVPTPLTHQPPLYPLAVAAVSKTVKMPVTDVALFISVAGYAFVLLAGYGIARRLFGRREALATVLLLSLYAPLREFCQSAFSEPMALVFLFTSLWLLAVYAGGPARRWWLVPLAGLIAATAVATRYALAPLVVIGALFVFIQRLSLSKEPGQKWLRRPSPGKKWPGKEWLTGTLVPAVRDAAMFSIGPVIVAVVLIRRNLQILDGSLVPAYLPSNTGVFGNIRNSLASLASDYADPVPDLLQFAVLLAVVAGLLILARRQGRLQPVLASVLTGRNAQLLTAFSLAYVLFLVAERSRSFIDPIGARYLLPASVVIVMLFAVFVVRAGAMNFRKLAMAGCLVALGMVAFEARTTLVTPAYRIQRMINKSDRLTWIQHNTDNSDLIIGEDTVDVPFYFHRSAAVSYSPYPYTETMPYPKLMSLCQRFRRDHDRILLVLKHHSEGDWRTWESRLGPFIHSASAGHVEAYPQVKPVADLRDGRVYEIECQAQDQADADGSGNGEAVWSAP